MRIVLVLTSSHYKQFSIGTSVKLPSTRFPQATHSVISDSNQFVSIIKCPVHHSLFTFTDARRDWHISFLTHFDEMLFHFLHLIIAHLVGALHISLFVVFK